MSSPARLEAIGLSFSFVAEQKSAAAILQQLSGAPKLAGVVQASRLEVRSLPETASSGIPQIDALTGGLPRGCLTEICGPASSGRTSLLLSALRAATRREEICTLIDVSDAFDPHSANIAGINLERLLWVRCGGNFPPSSPSGKRRPAQSLEEWERRRREDPVEQALKATDLLLQSSGFGLVVIDLTGVPLRTARRIPLTTWFRFQRAVENTATILLVIGEQACAQSCATMQLALTSVLSFRSSVLSQPETGNHRHDYCDQNHCAVERPSHTELLSDLEIHAEVLRSRSERKPMQSIRTTFETKSIWDTKTA
jgi:hypothetical protein